jgi:YHS domain-containing protein
MKTLLKFLLISVALIGLTARAEKPINTTLFGVAIKGYDPVAYFTAAKPTKGSSDHTFEWNGAKWHFASAANKDLFAAAPEKYAPQYGGYCAWAVSNGYTAPIDPDAWRIVEGKLYLNYNAEVRTKWQQDVPGNIQKADKHWPEVLKK